MIFFLLLSSTLNAQLKNYHFEKLNTDDGLSNNAVNAIVQDKNGFMWLSTQEGLNRFDGSHFIKFYSDPKNPNSLCHNLIWNMYQDSNGKIWILTQNGLSIFNPETENFRNFFHNPNDSTSISHNALLSATEDHNGNIWIGTSNGELNRYNPTNNTFTSIKVPKHGQSGIRPNYIVDLLTDSNGKIWVGMYDGFSIFDPELFKFISIPSSEKPGKFKGRFIRSLYEDTKGNIWIGTIDRGFSKYDPRTKIFKHYGDNKIKGLTPNYGYHIAEDSLGNIWLGAYLNGLYVLNPKTDKVVSIKNELFNETSLSDNSINCIFTDHSGTVWIGTYNNGINLYNPNQPRYEYHKHKPIKNSLVNSLIYLVHEDTNNDLWIYSGSILQKYDREKKTYTNYSYQNNINKINSRRVNTFHSDNYENLWIGTGNGINVKNKNDHKFRSITLNDKKGTNNSVYAFYEDKNNLWIGTANGLYHYDLYTGQFLKVNSTAGLIITSIMKFKDGTNRLLLGTRRGLFKYNITKNETIKINAAFRESFRITKLFYTGNGNYWLSTDRGFVKYNSATNQVQIYSPSFINLSNIAVYYPLDQSKVLAGSSNGLYLIDEKGKEKIKEIKLIGTKNSYQVIDIFKADEEHLILVCDTGIRKLNINTFDSKIIYFNKTVSKFGYAIFANTRLKSGKLLFGSYNFFIIYDPVEGKFTSPKGKVNITDLYIDNQRVTVKKFHDGRFLLNDPIYKINSIELDYSDMPITFNFSSTNYANFRHQIFQFQLEGIDNKLSNYTDQTRITYRIIPPGDYKFKVYYRDKNDNKVFDELSLGIIINPPFYSSTWFKILISLFSLFVLYTGYIFRVNYIKSRNKELRRYNEQLNQEINERKRAEKAVTESEKKYRTLFSSIADPILIIDSSTKRIIECNERAISDLGYSKNELLQMEVFDLHPEEEIPFVNSNLSDQDKVGPNYYTYIKKDGTRISVEVHTDFLVYQQRPAWISIIRDVTEKIKAERELEKLNKSLDSKNQELEQIIYVSSHDLRTPLVNIQGFSSEIEMELKELKNRYPENKGFVEKIIDETFNEPISFIKENTSKMDLLLNGLSRFSRLGRDKLSYEYINTSVLVQSVITSLRHLMKNQDIEIRVGVLPKFFGDLELIKQVFSPLIENAILYREKSRETIIKIEGTEDDSYTSFTIEDNGIGIAEAHQNIIFEIFHKLNPKTSTGIGLGLTFASKIVRAHNGQMNVISKLGSGSKFTFSIPKK